MVQISYNILHHLFKIADQLGNLPILQYKKKLINPTMVGESFKNFYLRLAQTAFQDNNILSAVEINLQQIIHQKYSHVVGFSFIYLFLGEAGMAKV